MRSTRYYIVFVLTLLLAGATAWLLSGDHPIMTKSVVVLAALAWAGFLLWCFTTDGALEDKPSRSDDDDDPPIGGWGGLPSS